MRLTIPCFVTFLSITDAAFAPFGSTTRARPSVVVKGYLDDLTTELYAPNANPDVQDETHTATDMTTEEISQFGPGNFDDYVEFNEFDGGDGQMGVAGDGNKNLEKFDERVLFKSRSMSAKNAWGTSTGYADTLIDEGVDNQRAQQLENWRNQRELKQRSRQQREFVEQFDQVSSADEDWRALAKFGVERNENFNMNERFGAVTAGNVFEEVIEIVSNLGQNRMYELELRNEFMGFADFRASFTSDSPRSFTVTPTEGSLSSREDTKFLVRFRPDGIGITEGYLVIETEDFKKTWKIIGSTA